MQSSPQAMRPAVPPSTALRTVAELTGARPVIRAGHADADAAYADLTGIEVTGIEQRSNAVQPGDLFAGLAGAKAHGARFAADAVARGAVAVLTDPAGVETVGDLGVPVLVHDTPRAVLGELSAAVYGYPSRRLRVVGITGTSGKTTTAYLVEAGLAATGSKVALLGTIETRIEGERVPSALTTPEAPQLHALFAVMVERGVEAVVMEVSSHALALGRVDGVEFAVGAFTNLSQDHLDFHADFEDYFAAKRRLFEPSSSVAAEISVLCVDDAWGRRLAREIGGRTAMVTVAGSPGGDLGDTPDWTVPGPVEVDDTGQEFTVLGPDGEIDVRLRLPGRYNVANAVLAVAVCAAAGADPAVAAAALAEVDVPGRMQRVEAGQDFLAVVDYAHKPAAIESVIATLRKHLQHSGSVDAEPGRLAVVVGAGGDRDTGKRPLMGAAAARGADLLVITDDNPRSEDPASIRAAVRAGAEALPAGERGEIREIGDRRDAIAAAVDWARPGDVVLVAGKGHETGQEIAGVKHPFDDREVLAIALHHKTTDHDPESRRSAPDSKDLTVS